MPEKERRVSFRGEFFSRLLPCLTWLPSVDRNSLRADLFAGFTNATIVLPQAIAFATIAGLPPEFGIYTAMITPIVAAIFGSSMVMISGPTTAISAVVFNALYLKHDPGSPEFIESALILTLLVGAFQLALGLAKLGRLVTFVSHSVLVGFTAAAAVLIGISQMGDVLGVVVERGGTVVERAYNLFLAVDVVNWRSVVIAGFTLVLVLVFRRISPRLPGFLLAMLGGGILAWLLDAREHGVAMVGELPSITPSFYLPDVTLESAGGLSESAFAIALIALLEAVSIGRAFATRTHTRFNANQEIIGQGMSNMVGGMFQAYAGSGSFTRSGVNYEAGAKTPISAIISSILLGGMLFFIAPLVSLTPLPAMAGIILYVAWKLIDRKEIRHILQSSRSDSAVVIATVLAGLFVRLEFAIYVGVILSLLIFLSNSARPKLAISSPDPSSTRRSFRNVIAHSLVECPEMVFARIDGAVYFGSVETIEAEFRKLERDHPGQQHLVLVLKGVGEIDLAAADMIVEEHLRRRARGGALHIVARYPPMLKRLRKLRVMETIGAENVFESKGTAIEQLVSRLPDDACANCSARVFLECKGRPGAPELEVLDPQEEEAKVMAAIASARVSETESGEQVAESMHETDAGQTTASDPSAPANDETTDPKANPPAAASADR